MKRTALNIQAEGLNELNSYTIEILNHIIPQMQKLVGVKILTQQGKSKKWHVTDYKKEDTKGEGKFIGYNYYLDFSGASVWMKTTVRISGGSYDTKPTTAFCEYLENHIYIGSMLNTDNYSLGEVKDVESIVKDWKLNEQYTESELDATVKEFEALKNRTREIYNKIPASVKKAKFLSYN